MHDALRWNGKMSRVHLRHLGPPVTPPGAGLPLPGLLPYNAVQFGAAAHLEVRRQMTAWGQWRGGLAFGHCADDVLRIEYIAPGGYPWWATDLLEGDPRYALGWADALRSAHPAVDWVGSWLLAPNNALPSYTRCEHLLRAGHRTALFDADHPLIAFGLLDQTRHARVYRLVDDAVEVYDAELGT